MSKTYEIAVLVGTIYTVEVEAENLEAAYEIADTFDPSWRMADDPAWEEVETDRTIVIYHDHGYTSFGFGVAAAEPTPSGK